MVAGDASFESGHRAEKRANEAPLGKKESMASVENPFTRKVTSSSSEPEKPDPVTKRRGALAAMLANKTEEVTEHKDEANAISLNEVEKTD